MAETIVVIAILSLLVSLVIPAIQYARAASDKLVCQDNIRQLGVAFHHRQSATGTFIPKAWSRKSDALDLSWMVQILPEIEQDALYAKSIQALGVTRNLQANPPHAGLSTVVPLYACPSDGRLKQAMTDTYRVTASYTSYIGLGAAQKGGVSFVGAFGMVRPTLSHIHDGLSNTVMLSERPPPGDLSAGKWYSAAMYNAKTCEGPNTVISLGAIPGFLAACGNRCSPSLVSLGPGRLENPCDRFHLWSMHGKGAFFLFADGSVRFLGYATDPIIPELVSVNGGDPVEIPE